MRDHVRGSCGLMRLISGSASPPDEFVLGPDRAFPHEEQCHPVAPASAGSPGCADPGGQPSPEPFSAEHSGDHRFDHRGGVLLPPGDRGLSRSGGLLCGGARQPGLQRGPAGGSGPVD